MKFLITLAFFLSCLLAVSQGSLQFNAAKIITYGDGVQSVPAGKVWKVMSVYGANSTTVGCFALPAFCVNSSWPSSSFSNIRGKGYKVNGTVVWQTVDLSQSLLYYQFNNCTGATTTATGYPDCTTAVNIAYPNQTFSELEATLPFWMPAGATLEVLGTATNISVLEFNIVP